ncbi:unnamed protein product [Ambrosiozyma monospora]|uniref:Unnamed protein product n=1 Tax=Ambrosiozyma monospora TaxID=43982 RepID=A0ACB5TCY2_AMBMO|nr:unnamed protein product [Ambrosiozyma monospora]
MELSKINLNVDYPTEFNLDKYWPAISSPEEAQKLSKLPARGQIPPFNYKLFGVINHFGNLVNGHYTSYVDKGGSNGWCYFDDDRVTKNCSLNKVINGDAYVLFYSRV